MYKLYDLDDGLSTLFENGADLADKLFPSVMFLTANDQVIRHKPETGAVGGVSETGLTAETIVTE
ncbi:MAG: hypothetical protein JHC62_07035 [Microbacteriaceae bacterium]|nr:hypothetical protein [Microbacteriaceae bacterium]